MYVVLACVYCSSYNTTNIGYRLLVMAYELYEGVKSGTLYYF